MRIVQVCPRYYPDIGGIETHVKWVSEELARRGYGVLVVCTDPSGRYPEEEVINGVRIRRFSSFAPNDNYYISPQITRFLKNEYKFGKGYDVIHAHSYHAFPSFFASKAISIRKTKTNGKPIFIFTPHSFGFSTIFPRNILHKMYAPFGRSIFEKAKTVITISRIEHEWITRTFTAGNLKFIPLPIKVGLEDDILKNSNIRTKGKKRIVFVGRLSEEKNVGILISAFAKIRDNIKGELCIVGDGPELNTLKSIVQKLGDEDISFLGALPHSETLYRLMQSDVFVLPSSFEVSPISVWESLALGTPVITTPVGELPLVLRDGEQCIFTKIGDVKDLSSKLLWIFENKKSVLKMRKKGKRLFEKRHNLALIIDKYEEIYGV